MTDDQVGIVQICQLLHQRNLLAAADGNVSLRISDEEILITPTGRHKGFINSNDLARINIRNEILSGKPSGERLMHLQIYRSCPQAKAVVHAHPPTAIAFSVAFPELKELPYKSLSELILAAGRIPIAPYARPGTVEMGEVLVPFLPTARVLILARHGGISWGESLQEAYFGMERLEHVSQILKSALSMGQLSELPAKEIESLFEMRKTFGDKLL